MWFSQTNGYLNEIIKEVERVFTSASQMGPVLVFIDEFDSLPSRASLGSRNRDYWVPLINFCLTTFEAAIAGNTGNIILIGASNFPENIDPALLRPGRLGRVITISRPDAKGLAGILRQHLGPDVLDGADLSVPATLGVGATGAQATAWVAGAERRARDAGRPMRLDDLIRQIAPPDPRSHAEILAASFHEASHAVAVHLLGVGEIVSLSNVLIGGQGGLTKTKLNQGTTMTRAYVEAYVVSVLAGRAGDQVFGEVNSGSGGAYASDLGMATTMLSAVHCSLGLGGTLVHLASEGEAREFLRHDLDLRRRVENDLNRLFKAAVSFVEAHRSTIETLARRLVEARIMPGDEVRRVIAQAGARPDILATLGGHDG
nr:AAA family ATPase [Methylobacterium sp. BTF04]